MDTEVVKSALRTNGAVYKTVFHALVSTMKPREGIVIDDDTIDLLVGSTILAISKQLPAMIEKYKLHAYRDKFKLSQEKFKQVTLLIGMMDIYNRNVIVYNSSREMLFVHHMPFFMLGRLTMVFEKTDGGVVLTEEIQTVLPVIPDITQAVIEK